MHSYTLNDKNKYVSTEIQIITSVQYRYAAINPRKIAYHNMIEKYCMVKLGKRM